MTRTEERLRDAFAGAAHTVRRRDLRPLEVVPPRPPRVTRWTAPLVAAISVAALVVLGLQFRDDRPNPETGVMAAKAAPRFFLSVEAEFATTTGNEQELRPAVAKVRSAQTGAVVSTVPSVPGVTWDVDLGVTAAPGGQVYVLRGLAARPPSPHALYRDFVVRLNAQGRSGTPVELPIVQLRDQVPELAVSPDAKLVAFILGAQLGVADVRTGRVRTWAGRMTSQPILQWTADGHQLMAVYQHSATQVWIESFDPELRGAKATGQIALPAGQDYLGAMVYSGQYVMGVAKTGTGVVSVVRGSLVTGRITRLIASWTVPPSATFAPGGWTMDPATGHVLVDVNGRIIIHDLRTGQNRTLPTTLPNVDRAVAW